MKQKILLSFLLFLIVLPALSQKKVTAYAITGPQKGQSGWTEVRLVDIATGDEVQSIYKTSQKIDLLNARTGKPIVMKENGTMQQTRKSYVLINGPVKVVDGKEITERKVRTILTNTPHIAYDKPFATNSAACAYDKKHDRLYYTPMGINELRYIDLKSKTPRIFYFENEPFGALSSPGDVANQITRMVIASDGNGYALTNNAKHLIKFTTNKKPVIIDLGSITDDASNGANSIHNQSGYGGDMVAHSNGDLYLLTANRKVFQINVENRSAKYLGQIQGLPKGFTTNGAMVEQGMTVIVCSSNSTQGYFKFDITSLQAEKVSESTSVYNASDLANGNLLSEKKRKKKDIIKEEVLPAEPQPLPVAETKSKPTIDQLAGANSIAVYPNPVTTGMVKLAFRDQPEGKYKIQLLDISGKLISQQEVTINNKLQVQEVKLPSLITAGNYMIQVVDKSNKVVSAEKLIVQQ
jgi:hypothetical protein